MSLSSTRDVQLKGTMGYVRKDCKDCGFDEPVTKAILRNDREVVVDCKIGDDKAFIKAESNDGINFDGRYTWWRSDDTEEGKVKFRLFTNLPEYLFFGSCVDPAGYEWIWWLDLKENTSNDN